MDKDSPDRIRKEIYCVYACITDKTFIFFTDSVAVGPLCRCPQCRFFFIGSSTIINEIVCTIM